MTRIQLLLLVGLPHLAISACDFAGAQDGTFASDGLGVTIPPVGKATTLDFGGWNVEWFGSTGEGPEDEALQLANVRAVIAGSDLDVWGLAEVVSTTQFERLKAELPGYSGFLADASSVADGSSFYTSGEQKVGILFKSSIASVLGARLILTENGSDFAGRPPLEVTLRVTLNGTTENVVVIVIHAKAFADTASWQRRVNASAALKSFLDSTYPTEKVIVLGDFNDDVDRSILPDQDSPYRNFVADAAHYAFPTQELSEAGFASTAGDGDAEMIDHHLETNEMNARYLDGSADVYRTDDFIPGYSATTSDHFPVLSRYTWSRSAGGAQILINEIGANEPGSGTAGEFIELVNLGSRAADISGWTLSDASSVRHTFPSGSTLAAGDAIVVYGARSALPSGPIGAVAATSGSLNLSNNRETITLRDSGGAIVDGFSYDSSLAGVDGVSMNRSPDGSAGPFVLHTALSSLPSSPGTRADGSSW